MAEKIIFAVPKGRILSELLPILEQCSLIPEPAFLDPKSRKLQFSTNHDHIDIIRVRAFDVATFTAFGAAHLGIVGSDVIEEFDYSELYAPVNLDIGKCRLSVAMAENHHNNAPPLNQLSHVRVATKYPNLTQSYYARHGVQAECIKLNGAMEIAPKLNLCRRIVDLVSTGSTLKANGLCETDVIMDISSYLVVNRTALKTRPTEMKEWIEKFRNIIQNNK